MIDWKNDSLFFTHNWEEETSAHDSHPSTYFSPGNDCYMGMFSARVPIAIKNDEVAIEDWISTYIEKDEEGFWVDKQPDQNAEEFLKEVEETIKRVGYYPIIDK